MHRLRPFGHLFTQGIVAVIVFMTPVFIVLYVVTLANGRWFVVFVMQVVVTLLVVMTAWGYFGVAIWVSSDAISERGFFGRKFTFRRDEIASIVIAETYVASTTQTVPQLFVCDHDGKQLIRMRGQFWSRENMELVQSTLGVPSTVVSEAVTTAELRQAYPGLLYWFERHPVLTALALTGILIVVAGLVMAFLFAAGIR